MKHGNAGLLFLILILVVAVLAFVRLSPTPDTLPQPDNVPAPFPCAEDEVYAYVHGYDGPQCVHIERFRQLDILELGRDSGN